MFLYSWINTSSLCHFDSFFDHIKQISQTFVSIRESFHMISHSNDQNRATCFVKTTKTILSWCVYFGYNFLILWNLVRFVFLEPFDPVFPHLNYFFLIKFSGNTESSDRINVSVEILFGREGIIFCFENFNYVFSKSFHLSKFAVGDIKWVMCWFHFMILIRN